MRQAEAPKKLRKVPSMTSASTYDPDTNQTIW